MKVDYKKPNHAAPVLAPRTRRSQWNSKSAGMRSPWVIPEDTKLALERCELFQDMETPQLMQVAALVEESSLEPGEMLLREGLPASNIFVIVQGQGIAQLKLDRRWLSLGLVGPGEVAVWTSLVNGQLYPASVKALTQMKVARIETSGLTMLMNLEPDIGYPVHRRLSSIFCRQYLAALNAIKTSA